jgi:uncharacterized DUF497 family protein
MTQQRFTWDPTKAEANRAKHGVSFEEAMLVFRDPLHLTRQDRIEDGEIRYQTIGQIYGVIVLLVAHTVTEDEPDPVEWIRIISARRATRAERRRYEDESD